MMAVWGWDPTATALPVKLWEGRTNASTAGTNYPVPWTVEIVADVTNYPFYVVTMDAPWQYTPDTPDISAQCVLQTAGLSPLTYNAPNPQPCLGYLGTHAWGTSFGSTFPLNPDPSNPLYQMMKWMRVGVKK